MSHEINPSCAETGASEPKIFVSTKASSVLLSSSCVMEEDPELFYSTYIANSVVNTFLSYTAIMLNILTIHAMRKTSSLPKTIKTLLLSLAVSDLGVGLLVQPLFVIALVRYLQQKDIYLVLIAYRFASGLFAVSSFLSVTALSVDRFLAVHLHLRYQELVTHKRVIAAVITIWAFSTLIALLIDWDASIILIALTFISSLCVICTTIIYCKIYFAVRRHANQIQALQVQQVQNYGEMAANAAKLRKFAVSTFYVFLVFLFCYLPHICILVLRILTPKLNATLNAFEFYSLTLVYANSSLNPVVFSWKMRAIRHGIMDILRKLVSGHN